MTSLPAPARASAPASAPVSASTYVSTSAPGAADKYMRGAGSSAWLDNSAAHREARYVREARNRSTNTDVAIGQPITTAAKVEIAKNEIPVAPTTEAERIRQQVMVFELENSASGWASF